MPVIDVHFHYFMPDVLGPMKEFVIADPGERDAAMGKLVSNSSRSGRPSPSPIPPSFYGPPPC